MAFEDRGRVDSMRHRDKETGFSLVEVLAALAILSAAMIPLLSLQSTLVQNVIRLEAAAERRHVESVARSHVRLYPFWQTGQPTEIDLGGGWRMQLAPTTQRELRNARYGVGLSSRHAVELHRITVTLSNDSSSFGFEVNGVAITETGPYAVE